MTREKKIWDAVKKEHGKLSKRELSIFLTVIAYADKTMVEKAWEWIRDKIPYYIDDMIDYIHINSDKMEKDFRKAMLEE